MLNSFNNFNDRYLQKNQITRWFLPLLIVLFLSLNPIQQAFSAQSTPFSGQEFLESLASGQMSPNDAILELAQGTGLPIGDAQTLLSTITNADNLTSELAGDLLNSFAEDILSASDLQNITDMISNVQGIVEDFENIEGLIRETIEGNLPPELAEAISLLENPEAIEALVRETVLGNLPPELTEALTTIEGIGDLVNAESIAEVFENPLVVDALEGLQIEGITPAELVEQIQTIAGVISDPEAFIQENLDQVTEEILGALETAAPEVFSALADAFGGEEALNEAIGGLLGSLTGGLGGGLFGGGGEPGMCEATCSSPSVCGSCSPDIHNNHVTIRDHTSAEFSYYTEWFVTTYFIENVARSLMRMTSELTTNAMQQVQIIGTFFDAKHQLESQRLQQVLTAQARKDYQPSEALCVMGTNTRSLASSKRKADLAQAAISSRMMDRQLNRKSGISQEGLRTDSVSRIDQFIEKFCNQTDGGADGSGQYGLSLLCADSSPDSAQVNADVNYTSTIESKLTLDIDFTNQGTTATADEENIFALGANIFAHDTLRIMSENELQQNPDLLNKYLNLRSMAAKRSVAQHSFASITGMRAKGDGAAAPFLKALLSESGVSDSDLQTLIGDNPSYFAQEEIMTKALYQNPTFYSNLYDKPANVDRMGTALLAMEIIQDRNIYESLLRSEAVLATLVETTLLKEQRRVSGDLGGLKITGRKRGN